MNNPDHIFWSLETNFFWVKILKFFDADPGSGMETVRIRDGKKSDPGSGINIPDPQHWSVVLFERNAVRFPESMAVSYFCCVFSTDIIFSRMKLYLSWCSGSHHFHSKVLLTNIIFSRMKLYLSWCPGSHHFHSWCC